MRPKCPLATLSGDAFHVRRAGNGPGRETRGVRGRLPAPVLAPRVLPSRTSAPLARSRSRGYDGPDGDPREGTMAMIGDGTLAVDIERCGGTEWGSAHDVLA